MTSGNAGHRRIRGWRPPGETGCNRVLPQLAETLTATSLVGFVELVSRTLSPPDQTIHQTQEPIC
jgi:hypothetical protein